MKGEDKIISSINEFTKEQLVSLLGKFVRKNKSIRRHVINFIDANMTQFKKINEKELSDAKYGELWGETDRIISEFDEYGGGSDENEEIVYNNLEEIVNLFKRHKLDENSKKEFIENCIHYYLSGNSGFNDLLVDSFFDVCSERKDWLFTVEKLKEGNRGRGNYTHDLIMKIYRDKLNDDENYLKERTADLEYGMDYYDLVTYYEKKGNATKAFETAKEGLAKGEGRIKELIEFMVKHYNKQNDYQNALKFLIMQFEDEPELENYKAVEKFCKSSEWEDISKKLYARVIKEPSIKAEIDYYNKDYRLVWDYVKNYPPMLDYYCEFDAWAKKLEPHFPKEILGKYKEIVHSHIATKKAKNYFAAKRYCMEIKRMLLNDHKEKEWGSFISSIRKQYQNLPALQRELNGL